MSRPSQNQRGVPLRVTVSTKPPPKEERRFLKRLDGIWHLAAPAPLSPKWLCGDGSRKGGRLRHLIVRRAPNGAGANRPDRPHSPDPSNINLSGADRPADDQPAAAVRSKSLRVSGGWRCGRYGRKFSYPVYRTVMAVRPTLGRLAIAWTIFETVLVATQSHHTRTQDQRQENSA